MRGGASGQVTACIFGLKNAVPEEWRDIQHQHLEHTGKDSGSVGSNSAPRRASTSRKSDGCWETTIHHQHRPAGGCNQRLGLQTGCREMGASVALTTGAVTYPAFFCT